MKLYVNEINGADVYQTIKPKVVQHIKHIRPHLYVKGNPTGSVKVKILAEDGTLIKESNVVNFSAITSAPEYHGYITFDLDVSLKKNTNYKLAVSCLNGYSFNESAFCGVCTDFGLSKYTTTQIHNHGLVAPLDFEIWCLSDKG